jgi:hypothetical protein
VYFYFDIFLSFWDVIPITTFILRELRFSLRDFALRDLSEGTWALVSARFLCPWGVGHESQLQMLAGANGKCMTLVAVKFFQCIITLHAMCTSGGSEFVVSRKTIFGPKWRWVVSFTPLLLYPKDITIVGWGTMLQAGRSRVRVRWGGIFHPSSRTMALGSTQPLTEMSTRNLPGG